MTPAHQKLVNWAALFLIVFAAFMPAMSGGFIWDDEAHILENATLRTAQGFDAIWTKPGATPQYYPLVHTVFWLEYHAWQLNPAGYHYVNLALHAVNACLLFVLLSWLGVPGAWWGAALFALHPVQVESVAWITELKNVLSTFFYFSSALAWFSFAGIGSAPRLRFPAVAYLASWLLFGAALLSKTVTCSLPAALLLVTWWKQQRITRRDVFALLPFFGVGLVAGLGTAWLERAQVGARGADWAFSFVDRCLIAGRAAVFYFRKLIWPGDLVFMYPRWTIDSASVVQYAFPIAVLAALVVLWCKRARWGRAPFVVAALFVGTLFPALGFFNVYPMRYAFVADHFQYLACAPVLAAIAAILFSRWPRWASIAAAAVVLLLGCMTWTRAHVFRSAESLWRDTLLKNPSCWMAHNNLGLILQSQGKFKEATSHFEAALALKSDAAEALTNLGVLSAAAGDPARALDYHIRAVKADPRSAMAQNNLGMALAQAGKVGEGIEHLRISIQIKPRYAGAHANLANASAIQGDMRTAASEYRIALALSPGHVESANNLAWILATAKEPNLRGPAEAVQLAEYAVKASKSKSPGLLDTLAAAYASAGRYEEAVKTGREAVQMAEAAGTRDMAQRMSERLRLYSSGKPYVSAPAPKASP